MQWVFLCAKKYDMIEEIAEGHGEKNENTSLCGSSSGFQNEYQSEYGIKKEKKSRNFKYVSAYDRICGKGKDRGDSYCGRFV